MRKNKVSVIIPTIGRLTLFKLLNRLLNQTKRPDEILIMDNSNNKNAFKIFLEFKKEKIVKYYFLKRKGQYHALNIGINKAKFDNLCFIDDDCLPTKNWLKNLFHFYLNLNQEAVIIGRNENFDKNNLFSTVEYFNDQSFFEKFFYRENNNIYSFFLDTKNMIINKALIKKNHLKFNDFKYLDLDFSFQLINKNIKIIYCPKALSYHIGQLDFFNHLKREFFKGVEIYQLFLKWRKRAVYKKMLFYYKFFKNKDNFRKRWLKKKILESKNLYFILCFYLLYYFDYLIRLIGLIFSKLSFSFLSQKGR